MTHTFRISAEINGAIVERDVSVRQHLADFLRDDLKLTGTHLGCEHGVCGACTVIADGLPVRSCLMLAVQADGMTIRTIEGFADPSGELHPVQAAFRKNHALQCGFCTPGMLATAIALVESNPNLSDEELLDAMSGHICRCTGYHQILAAVREAADAISESAGQ